MTEIQKVKVLIATIMSDVGVKYELGKNASSQTIKVGMDQAITAHEISLKKITELWPETLQCLKWDIPQ